MNTNNFKQFQMNSDITESKAINAVDIEDARAINDDITESKVNQADITATQETNNKELTWLMNFFKEIESGQECRGHDIVYPDEETL